MIDIGIAGHAPWPQLCVHGSNSPRNTWPLEALRDDCVCLLEASGRSRYPGWDSPDEADASPAIEAARRVRSAIRERTASDSEA